MTAADSGDVLNDTIKRSEIAEAIKLLKDWASWLVGIQTASIAALGVFSDGAEFHAIESALAAFMAVAFLVSICAATFLFVSLPAFLLRCPEVSRSQDILDRGAFRSRSRAVERISVLHLVALVHWPFALGVTAFVVCVVRRLLI